MANLPNMFKHGCLFQNLNMNQKRANLIMFINQNKVHTHQSKHLT